MEQDQDNMRKLAKMVYDSLQGQMRPQCRIPWVENAMAEGHFCCRKYGEMLDAYWHLCERLGTDEDPDGEIMIDSLLMMQEELCLLMFEYGVKYAEMSR